MNEPPDRWEEQVRDTARHFPYPPTPNLAVRFRRPHRMGFHMPRLRLALALCFVIALLGLLTVPGVRAGLADFLQIGTLRIWRTPPKPTIGMPNATSLPLGEKVTLIEAQSEVWYPIRLPTYPDGIGAPDEVYLLNPEEDGIHLVWYASAIHPELRLTQFGAGFWVNKWGPALESQTPSTLVNGRYAVWVQGPHVWSFLGQDGNRSITVPEDLNVLIWAERNVTYRLESSLLQEEAVKVAESLE
jgi:hypothetical protein